MEQKFRSSFAEVHINNCYSAVARPKPYSFAEKAKFFEAMRKPGETVREWATRLEELASYCDFGAALETNLRDRFILGLGLDLGNDQLFEQESSTLTFARALELAEEAESARELRILMGKEQTTTQVVTGSTGATGAPESTVCSVCGFTNHKEPQCRYKAYKCHKCGKQGHLKKMCGESSLDDDTNNINEIIDRENNADGAESEGTRMLNLRSPSGEGSCETCCCIPIETVGYIFAVINAIGITIGALFSLGFFAMMLRIILDPDKVDPYSNSNPTFLFIVSILCVVGTAIAEVFAVLLCVGISRKIPRFVKAYLVFGITVEILSVTSLVCFIAVEWDQLGLVLYSLILLGLCGIYALPLLLVKKTHTVLSGSSQVDNRRLIHNERSFCSREICCGMKIETGGFVFAIVNAVIVTAGALCCFSFFGYMLRIRFDPEKMREQETNSAFLFFLILSVICFVGAVIAEVFAVLLCVGISRKKPRFVMAYLVYGIITEILSVIGIVWFICMEWGEWDLVTYGASLLGFCGIYALLLLLVKQSYVVISNSAPPSHRRLINNQFDF